MRRLTLVLVAILGLCLLMAGAPHLLYALQQDTVVVHDKLGIFGPVLDKFWPVIVTFLTSLTVKAIALANKGFARTSEPVKWAALYFFALLYNLFAHWVGLPELDALAPVLTLSLVQTGAAALIYKFGQHKTPILDGEPIRHV